ncbi:MAG: 1-acyl-sn-glycerol-3-phosphate acyltransferase [Clostridia bacterium]|nr:1-acyl-sn-glycerol-3-phosphate acyltransferase [Clostridia bacterium]
MKKEKKTIAQKLASGKAGKPSFILYHILMIVVRIWNRHLHTHFTYKVRPGKDKGPFVYIANHASRNDFLFTAPACLPHRLNYVVGYNEFFRFPLNLVFKFMNVIPKRNFTPDVHTIHEIMRVIKRGGRICFMPEGMSSITGMQQPVVPGGGKLLKKLGVPVYYSKISGGYLTYPKHTMISRPGKIEVVVDRMFTPEELKELTPEEIEDRMNMLLAHDDYIWNETAKIKFGKGDNRAEKINTLLYRCCKCGAEGKMTVDGNVIKCSECGNAVELDPYYQISPVGEGSVCPKYVTDWVIEERKVAEKQVREENFSYSGRVRIGFLPEYKFLKGDSTSVISGEGILKLDREGLHFDGTNNGEPFSFDISSDNLPTYGMCTDISRIYTFIDGDFIEFYPESNDVLKWLHLTEEVHRANGGKWQNTSYRHRQD